MNALISKHLFVKRILVVGLGTLDHNSQNVELHD